MKITYKPVGINETAEWGDYDHLMQRWGRLGEVDGKKPHSRNEGEQRLSRLRVQPDA